MVGSREYRAVCFSPQKMDAVKEKNMRRWMDRSYNVVRVFFAVVYLHDAMTTFWQLPPPSQPITHPGPLPDSTFIATAREAAGTGPSVGTSISQKAQQMKQEKLRQFEEKKEAEVLKKLQEAEKKAQEKKAIAAEKVQRKKEAAEQKKLETQQRKAQVAEEKKKEQEEKKLAQAAAKAAAAEERRIEQQKKKANQAAAKAAAAERRSNGVGSSWTGDYPGTRTSMFDIFRD